MKFYKIGYHSYEECPDVTLCHEKDFTKEDIENMLVEFIKSCKDLLNKEFTYKNNLSEIMFGRHKGKNFITFLVEEKEFITVKYTAQYSAFGWADVFTRGDWEDDREDLKTLTDKLTR